MNSAATTAQHPQNQVEKEQFLSGKIARQICPERTANVPFWQSPG
jgi:hypothetical protein